MRRRCNICEFVGEDFDFFKIKKKVCDACLKKINDDKQFKRKEKKEERKEYLKNWNLEHKEEKKEYNKKYYQENKENPEFKDMVTVRDRDTGEQERVSTNNLVEYLKNKII